MRFFFALRKRNLRKQMYLHTVHIRVIAANAPFAKKAKHSVLTQKITPNIVCATFIRDSFLHCSVSRV